MLMTLRLSTILVGLFFVFFAFNFTESELSSPNNDSLFKPKISSKASVILKEGPMRGFTLGLHSKDFNYDYEMLLKEIKTTGAPWVCLTFKLFQDNNNASSINIPPADDPFWCQVEKTSIQAKALGFKVLLFPIVLLKNPKYGEWRGTLRPMNFDAWYASYTAMITDVAQIAARTNADMLSVGSEFNSLDRGTKRWLRIIKSVKKVYDGALIYSANWDAIHTIQFHDQLDFLGMTGYFKLTKKKNPTVEELINAWEPHKDFFMKWQEQKNTPFIFTELGYTSQDGNNIHPWDYTIPNVLDLQEQKDCYTAFTNVWKKEESLYGVFFYDWFGIGGKEDFGYTPRGKPALEVAKEWF